MTIHLEILISIAFPIPKVVFLKQQFTIYGHVVRLSTHFPHTYIQGVCHVVCNVYVARMLRAQIISPAAHHTIETAAGTKTRLESADPLAHTQRYAGSARIRTTVVRIPMEQRRFHMLPAETELHPYGGHRL